ncbi:MAG TPA: prolyl oligopeptidase family serine peptidase [Burkholderiaceae bacterium]|nr:prolyl oligopeptidase family serine peptidase [Burkholderiaceae bacterium]
MNVPIRLAGAAGIGAALLALGACGSDDSSPSRGQLLSGPVQTAAVSTAQIDAAATAAGTAALAGPAACGVSVQKIEYQTVGGAGEGTNATAALMIPTGASAACAGPRPIVLYAHGTSFDRKKNMSAVTTDGEAGLAMAFFAAQGFIVVAPNYAGYDASTLPYHPYLNAEAQANDMVDALRAAKGTLPSLGAAASSRLFITGYSQGGHVAMATHRAIEQSYQSEFTVTASGPMSGPYALAKMTQAIFAGTQNIGAALFTPMVNDSYQRSYGNIYSAPSDVYQAPFDTIAPGLLPNVDPATAVSRMPAGADGSYRTLFDAGNGQPFLIKTSFRTQASDPNSNYFRAIQRNDLLNWQPRGAMALCYGAQDPTVFGFNSTDAQTYFAGRGVTVARYDLEDAATLPAAAAPVKTGFDGLKAQISAQAGGGTAGAGAVIAQYHGTIVPPFCTALIRSFFAAASAAP